MALGQKQIIDCKGMQCPAPILQIAKAARKLGKAPAVFEVLVDDGDFPNDLQAWCRTSNSQLVEIAESDGVYTATIALNGAQVTAQSGTLPVVEADAERAPTGQADAFTAETNATLLDCRGMQCPAPILELSKTARRFGKKPMLIDIVADDPDFIRDLEAWCRTTKSQICESTSEGTTQRVLLAINGAAEPLPITEVTLAARRSRVTPALADVQASSPAVAREEMGSERQHLDLRGLRAPQPMRRLSAALFASPGARLVVTSDDPAFMSDVMAWARATGVDVLSAQHQPQGSVVELQLADSEPPLAVAAAPVLGLAAAPALAATPAPSALSPAGVEVQLVPRENLCTILVIKNDFESLMAAMMCATTAAAQGMQSAVYFSFWGVNLLRGERPRANAPKERVNLLQRVMKWMMPKGPSRQKMSKMHMGGVGLGMMNFFMRRNNVMSLAELMDSAVEQNVKFIVCSMSMGIMGISKRDIMDLPNVEFAGVTAFVEMSRRSSMSLVF